MTEVNRHGYLFVKCFCNTTFEARVADRKRGWAIYCSKSCKARAQFLIKEGKQPRPATSILRLQGSETKQPPKLEPIEDWMIFKMFGVDMPGKSC